MIEQHRRYAEQSLTGHGGTTSIEYLFDSRPGRGEVAPINANVSLVVGHAKQQEKTDDLSDDRGKGGSLHLQIEQEDEKGIQGHIEDRTCHNAHHRIGSIALQAELVVERQ